MTPTIILPINNLSQGRCRSIGSGAWASMTTRRLDDLYDCSGKRLVVRRVRPIGSTVYCSVGCTACNARLIVVRNDAGRATDPLLSASSSSTAVGFSWRVALGGIIVCGSVDTRGTVFFA